MPESPLPNCPPKKKFSQNFLVNLQMQVKVAEGMLSFAHEFKFDYLLEIGPGRGDLTQYLLTANKPLLAIEIDPEAVAYLQSRFQLVEKLTILQQDALTWLTEPHPGNFVLLSNLPFGLGSRMLVELPILYPNTPFAVILQSDVAEKTKLGHHPTFFGFWLNLFWQLQIEFTIAPGNFYPVPKVYSSFVTAYPKSSLPAFLSTMDFRKKARFWLKTLFSQPRKTVGNNLKSVNVELPATWQKRRLTWENYPEILEFLTLNCRAPEV